MSKLSRRSLLTIALIVVTAVSARPESIYDMVVSGDVDRARDSLSRVASASSRDGDLLFFQALLESDANSSARLLEAALNASVSARYREEVVFRLAQYYFASGLDRQLALTVNRYRTEYENGRFDGHIRRLAIIADERAAKTETALRQLDRLLVSRADDEPSQWATIDKARIMMATDKRVAAVELLRRLSRQRSGPGPAQALYLLALDAFQYHRYDDAVFYYNLLREAYPKAVGLDVLIDKLSSVTGDESEDDLAERLTGTFYSVKVGVFSQIENARRQRDNFTKYDRRVEILTKDISGKKYYVVYVGRLSNYESAEQLKANLEATHNEVFQVVTR